VISFAAFFIPLYFVSASIRSENTRLESDLQSIQGALAEGHTPEPDVQDLMDELAQVQEVASEIEGAHSAVAAEHTDWAAVMAAIGNYDLAELTLTSLTEADNRIMLNGRAIDDSVVVAYAHSLEESNLFSRVVVQSLRTIATPFATPTSTAGEPTGIPITPTVTVTPTVTPTPTPSASDEYEVDDFEPKVIFLGQSQLHNFYPVYDVDKVKFLAKAGRYYRVFTSDLAPGVDTFLTVSLGGTTYTNDDREPGDLSSEVVFQVGSGRDVDAGVRVTNRGQYGPSSWYQITVEETIPTPTPTPAPTSTPSPTATPADTPTPTPDLRDEYEPDDSDPRPIAVGKAQTHNFYPENDVDKVKSEVQGGQWYRVSTSNLAPGVDTVIEVKMEDGTSIGKNDDIGPNGVCFPAPWTGTVVVIITNFEKQYGADKTYDITLNTITVNDVPELSVSPLSLEFTAVEGEPTPTPPAQEVNIANVRPCDLAWVATKGAGANWLSIAPFFGTAPSVMNVSVNATDLPVGTYTGSIVIDGTSLCTQNTPQTVMVTLLVTSTLTSTVSSRLPGVASLIPSSVLADLFRPLQMVTGRVHSLPPSSSASGDKGTSGVFSIEEAEAVEFVIVLELR